MCIVVFLIIMPRLQKVNVVDFLCTALQQQSRLLTSLWESGKQRSLFTHKWKIRDRLSGIILFHSHMRTPSLKYFQNHSISHSLSRHLQNTLRRPKNLFHHIMHCLGQRTSCKVFQVNACLTLPLDKWTQTLPLWEKKRSDGKILCDSWTCADQETMLILSFLCMYSYTKI